MNYINTCFLSLPLTIDPVGIEYSPSHYFSGFSPLSFPYKIFLSCPMVFLTFNLPILSHILQGWDGRGSEVSMRPCGCQGQNTTKGDSVSSSLFHLKQLIYFSLHIAEISNISKVRMNLEASWQYSVYQHVSCNGRQH